MRAAVTALRDDDRLDLATAMRALAADIPRPRVHVTFADSIRRPEPLPALTLLRCAQEIVTNAARHANADNLWIDLRHDGDALALSARDDGVGADRVELGRGLLGMRERLEGGGGRLEIATSRGQGFTVRATLPLKGARA